MTYLLSPSTFSYKKNKEEYILYNSLNLESIKVSKNIYEKLFFNIDSLENDETNLLYNKGFIGNKEIFDEQREAANFKHNNPGDTFINKYRIVLTEKYNLGCTYCFENTINNKKAFTKEKLKEALDFIITTNKLAAITIHWFGGEPFLKFDLIEYGMTYLNENLDGHINHTFTSHGGLITPKIAKFLSKFNSSVFISIDGRKEINDKYRVDLKGNGTYDKTVNAYYMLKAYGVTAGFLLTPYKDLTNTLLDSVKHVVEDLNCKYIGFYTPQPTKDGWELDGEIFANQLYEINTYCAENNVHVSSSFQRILTGLIKKTPMIHDCKSSSGGMSVSLSPNGKMGYCIVSWKSEEHSNDLNEDNLIEKAKAWKLKSHLTDQCKSCEAEMVCGGPCGLEAELGSLDKNRCSFYKTSLKNILVNAN